MKAKLQSLFNNDRGVSPVIGVILMVAITVILAAIIGTFVLGLGGDLQQTPQAQISIEAGSGTGDIDISHNGGEAIPVSDLEVSVGGSPVGTPFSSLTDSNFGVGDEVTVSGTGGSQATVTIIHSPSDSILVETEVTPPS